MRLIMSPIMELLRYEKCVHLVHRKEIKFEGLFFLEIINNVYASIMNQVKCYIFVSDVSEKKDHDFAIILNKMIFYRNYSCTIHKY